MCFEFYKDNEITLLLFIIFAILKNCSMKSDIIVIGAGASGLMAAYFAARSAADDGKCLQVTVLEKMSRPGRKIMITGKGRCNFTNLKDWNDFSAHVQAGSRLAKSAFYSFPSHAVIDFFESFGMATVVERGDRAFPASYRSSDVVDTLVNACNSVGVKILCDVEVTGIEALSVAACGSGDAAGKAESHDFACAAFGSASAAVSGGFRLTTVGGGQFLCSKLIVATGGLSYPSTGSTGDGLAWASATGHTVTRTFPSLTALVPVGYKLPSASSSSSVTAPEAVASTVPGIANPAAASATSAFFSHYAELAARHDRLDSASPLLPKHLDRTLPLSEMGDLLCGIHLKNVQMTLSVQDSDVVSEFGDLDFTDGGIEGPVGFQLSRKAVKALVNGSRVALSLDLKPAVSFDELYSRVCSLWDEINADSRSCRLKEKEKCRILLGKLIPWELYSGFKACNPGILRVEQRGRHEAYMHIDLKAIAAALKSWHFDIAGFVGYERAVITAGGVSADSVVSKTLESRVLPGLYFCGEVLDVDADTGGYNLQLAFCTGVLSGISAAKRS